MNDPRTPQVVVKTAVNGVAAHSRHFRAFISLPKEPLEPWAQGSYSSLLHTYGHLGAFPAETSTLTGPFFSRSFQSHQNALTWAADR